MASDRRFDLLKTWRELADEATELDTEKLFQFVDGLRDILQARTRGEAGVIRKDQLDIEHRWGRPRVNQRGSASRSSLAEASAQLDLRF